METSKQKPIGWLSAAHLVADTYTGFLNPIMPFLAAKLGFTMAIATVVISISHIFSSMLQPVFGFFADNMLKRFFIFWGLLFVAIFIPLSVLAPNVAILTFFVVLGSIGSSFFHPQALGFIVRFSQTNYIINMGIFMSAGTLGYSLGPAFAGMITQYFGLNAIPYSMLMGIIVAAFMFRYVPKISAIDKKPERKEFSKTFKAIFSNKNIMILVVISIMKSIISNSCFILLPFLWKDMNYTPGHIGMFLFAFIFAGSIASLLSERIEHMLGSKNVFYLSMLTMFPLMLLFVNLVNVNSVLYFLVFITMGFITMLATPVMMVMAQRLVPEFKSIIAGFINGFSWGLSAIFLTLVGFMAQKYGIPNVLVIVSFLPVLCSYFIKFLPDKVGD